MGIIESLENRRSVYGLGKGSPVDDDAIIALVKDATRLVPDAFNMRSQRAVVALGEKQDELWDAVYEAYERLGNSIRCMHLVSASCG